MKVVEITEKKLEKMSGLVEDMLLAGGELMHCLSKMEDEYYGDRRYDDDMRYSERSRMNMRGDMYGNRDDYDDMYGERRSYTKRRR